MTDDTTTLIAFATRIYRAPLCDEPQASDLREGLRKAAVSLADDDGAGRAWSEANDYGGYTSYASLNDLPWRMPEFQDLVRELDRHVEAFADELELDLGDGRLELDSLWVNVLHPGGHHAAHIHPHSVISGTYYVALPENASAIRYEDPRLAMMMAAPPRRADAARENKPFLTVAPDEGDVLLWESWLRHDVPVNRAAEPRLSISFNYAHVDGDEDDDA
jgi:uncharacterized protein (TIGR02466 family)